MRAHVLDALPDPRYPFDMAKEIPRLGDLQRKAEIVEAKIDAATDEDGINRVVFYTGLGLLGSVALLVGLGTILVMV